jgi:hypothetical protein
VFDIGDLVRPNKEYRISPADRPFVGFGVITAINDGDEPVYMVDWCAARCGEGNVPNFWNSGWHEKELEAL